MELSQSFRLTTDLAFEITVTTRASREAGVALGAVVAVAQYVIIGVVDDIPGIKFISLSPSSSSASWKPLIVSYV